MDWIMDEGSSVGILIRNLIRVGLSYVLEF